ncbi:MAG TPA: YIP1 family protein [Steroidobacteraceae bacterium]|nr:YIP1 family protein [Steroidobacteraceae bacterium]
MRPRRVFRDMASRPVGMVDWLLAAAQGVGNFLALYRTQSAGAHKPLEEILGNSFASGAVAGVASLFLMAVIYSRLAARAGGKATTRQMVHVLAYGGLPLVASLAIWLLTALLAGQAAFVETPGDDVEGFLVLLLHLQFGAYVLLLVWSIVLQLMGFSEVQGFTMRRAFGLWLLGQVIGFLASLFLALAVETLFPGLLLRFIPQR